MKRVLHILLFNIIFFSSSFSQEIVEWNVSYNQANSSIEFSAEIKEGWHLYSQHIDNNVGPVPTTFSFTSSNDFQLKGAVIEPIPIQKYDENFESMLDFFEKKVLFKQEIEVYKNTNIEGVITFMVCNETMCLPPVDYKYKINLTAKNQ